MSVKRSSYKERREMVKAIQSDKRLERFHDMSNHLEQLISFNNNHDRLVLKLVKEKAAFTESWLKKMSELMAENNAMEEYASDEDEYDEPKVEEEESIELEKTQPYQSSSSSEDTVVIPPVHILSNLEKDFVGVKLMETCAICGIHVPIGVLVEHRWTGKMYGNSQLVEGICEKCVLEK